MTSSKLYQVALEIVARNLKKIAMDANQAQAEITQTIKSAVEAAAGNRNQGIMSFVDMAKQDGVDLSFTITRNDGWGSQSIIVDNIQVGPASKALLQTKYAALKNQIETYLNRYWEVYPATIHGETVEYKNFVVTFNYNYGNETPGIASN